MQTEAGDWRSLTISGGVRRGFSVVAVLSLFRLGGVAWKSVHSSTTLPRL
jgi:hypothetical protein